MILSFEIENWMSFRDPVLFTMVAGRERQHAARVAAVSRYPVRILPVAALYGGNASGKSNFFKALEFMQRLVADGVPMKQRIPVHPFLLDPAKKHAPCRFKLEFLLEDTVHEFAFKVTADAVVEERLVKIGPKRETVLYHRLNQEPHFDKSLAGDQALHFAFKGTRDNQLFLTNTIDQRIEVFKPIYQWFQQVLTPINAQTVNGGLASMIDANPTAWQTLSRYLAALDTGVNHLEAADLPISTELLVHLKTLPASGTFEHLNGNDDSRIFGRMQDGNLIFKELVAYHGGIGVETTPFKFSQESDGTRRLIDLLPAFLYLQQPDCQKVFVIDEIGRSLHTLLVQKLIMDYLSTRNSAGRSQLIMTTHDLLLMDQDLFRRDEMWVAEKDPEGVSSLIAFSDYKDIRYDKDIRKSYLKGRLGGIPRLHADVS